MLERDKPWYEERLPMLEDRVRTGWTSCPAGLATPTGSMERSAPAT